MILAQTRRAASARGIKDRGDLISASHFAEQSLAGLRAPAGCDKAFRDRAT